MNRFSWIAQTFLAASLTSWLVIWSAAAVWADSPTPASTATPTVTRTASPPTARPVPTARVGPTARTVATAAPTAKPQARVTFQPVSENRHRSHKISHPHHAGNLKKKNHTATTKHARQHKVKRHKHLAKPKPTPTVPLTLQISNTVAPLTCNGPAKPDASHPFLTPPYRGWTSIVSYFDHDLPDYVQDGVITTATGAQATPDQQHQGQGFPAYWNPGLRQYIYYDGHNGYDYDISYQPVYAAAAGKVLFASMEYPDAPAHGYGNMVLIDHRNGYVTLYGHFSKLLVKAGQRVRRGQQIGISGNTGHSTGPHLHFTVFHNCSPTDPYGWSGPGPDPLSSYQGETSTYLWERPPLVINPPPRWPGTAALPASAAPRIVLLRLPPTSIGTSAFTRDLSGELAHVEKRLRRLGASVKVDPLQGAVDLVGDATAQQIYSASGVASITSPDTLEGARDDVMAALARAASVSKHGRFHLNKSRRWTGYLLHWSGRTFLLGQGIKGADVALKLTAGGSSVAKTAHADAKSGAYAIDLGRLSGRQQADLSRQLHGSQRAIKFTVRHHVPVRRELATKRGTSPAEMASYFLGLLVLAVLLVLAGWAAKAKWKPLQ